ncbi:hypothetical protein EDC04DRAFT_2653666 [Pisolithus marmoratus]|nr:hypothetical protein EDC04DRAFT_2653666 [Pisolithus marmoratus]
MISADYGNDGQTVHEPYANRVCVALAALASCPYVTTVGATIDMPEAAASFPGRVASDYLSKLASDTYEGLYNSVGRVSIYI